MTPSAKGDQRATGAGPLIRAGFGPLLEYVTPRLVNYGGLSRLTMSGSFVGNDGNTRCTGSAGANPLCAPLS